MDLAARAYVRDRLLEVVSLTSGGKISRNRDIWILDTRIMMMMERSRQHLFLTARELSWVQPSHSVNWFLPVILLGGTKKHMEHFVSELVHAWEFGDMGARRGGTRRLGCSGSERRRRFVFMTVAFLTPPLVCILAYGTFQDDRMELL